MDYFRSGVLLALCWFNTGEASARHGQGYGQYAYAAIPLHSPLPVLQLLSPQPIQKYMMPKRPRYPTMASASFPNRDLQGYASAHMEYYEPYEYPDSGSSQSLGASEEDAQAVVVYARPNSKGGYTYHKRPTAEPTPTPRPKREPIVFRIHKYKITRE
ncbi:unnamed protein product [Leptosia nina]|uniref:Uncharacterized protein n=1 Tax=Leptosia nina TaxID=320188 RepID=A0AAV1J375_9NEOP